MHKYFIKIRMYYRLEVHDDDAEDRTAETIFKIPVEAENINEARKIGMEKIEELKNINKDKKDLEFRLKIKLDDELIDEVIK